MPTVPTFHLYSLPEGSFISITIETDDLPQLSSELEILINCLWTFLPGVNTLHLPISLLQSAHLVFPFSVSVIITFLVSYARNLQGHPDSFLTIHKALQFCFWNVPYTSLFFIATQSSFLQINHNLMCHSLNLDNFYDFLSPTGQSLKSLAWQTRSFTTVPNLFFHQPWQTLFSSHLWNTHWLSVWHCHMSAPQFMWSLPGAHLPYSHSWSFCSKIVSFISSFLTTQNYSPVALYFYL